MQKSQGEVCYAPVFEKKSAAECVGSGCSNFLFIIFLSIVYVMKESPSIKCTIDQVWFKIHHCREGNQNPNIPL